jgi:hypothetical protein
MRPVTRVLALVTLFAVVAAPALAAGRSTSPGPHAALLPTKPPVRLGWSADTLATANWAGYAVTAPTSSDPNSFTHVIGTWTAPKTTCGANDWYSSAAFWVGLGGYNLGSQALEQIGTWADCNDSGPTSYFGWYELVPNPPLSFAMRIDPGDTLTASVTVSTTNMVTLELKNLTRHTLAIAREKDAVPDLSSAEWIAEAPTECEVTEAESGCQVLPLADFGKVDVSGIDATGVGQTGTLSSNPTWTVTPVQILSYDPSQPLDANVDDDTYNEPGAGTCTPQESGNGTAFSVDWQATAQEGC